jgi:hypothetical protein
VSRKVDFRWWFILELSFSSLAVCWVIVPKSRGSTAAKARWGTESTPSPHGKGEAENLAGGANVSVDGGSLICRYMGNAPNLVCS